MAATASPAPMSTQRSSYPSSNLQNLEQQLNSIYNSNGSEFNTVKPNGNTSAGVTQFNGGNYAARTGAGYNFTGTGTKKYSCTPERQRSQSLPHTNTRDAYVTSNNTYNNNSFRPNAQNASRLPVNNYANVAPSNASGYVNSQYQCSQNNDRVNVNQPMNYENAQFGGSGGGYNNVQQMPGYYADSAAALPQYHTPPQQQQQNPSHTGLPSPAPGTTAPTPSCFGHQHLATARHCNCNNQHCNSHFYAEAGDGSQAGCGDNGNGACKLDSTWQCNTARNPGANCGAPTSQMANCNASYGANGYGNMDQYSGVQRDAASMNNVDGYTNVYEDMQRNMNFNVNVTNGAANAVTANYNSGHGIGHAPMKYVQQSQHYQQQMSGGTHQPYQHSQSQQQQQFFQSQPEQRMNQAQGQQPFKTQQQYQEYHQQMQQQQNFQNRRASSGSTRGMDREVQSNVISQSSLNMRPAAYERTLQYVEQCQMFSVSSTTNQTDSSNMVINDMTSSLNSLLEENKYLQMIQQ